MLVKACLNGARRAGEHPALPISPEQLAADAAAVRAAGAGAVHVHPRAPDGAESLAGDVVAATVEAIRVACPGLPLGTTTGAWIERDPTRRLELVRGWRVPPDFASVNLSEAGAPKLMALLMEQGIGVEAGLIDAADAGALVAGGLAPRCLRVLVEVQDADDETALARVREIDAVLDEAGVTTPRLYHGEGRATWAVIAAARSRGRDVRIGLEDTLVLADGAPAADNAQLVAVVLGS